MRWLYPVNLDRQNPKPHFRHLHRQTHLVDSAKFSVTDIFPSCDKTGFLSVIERQDIISDSGTL